MRTGESRIQRLIRLAPSEAGRLVFRKAIYRRVLMRRYDVVASESVRPTAAAVLPIELLSPERFADVLGSTPYVDQADLERFRRQRSTCVIARDGKRIVASVWMTSGAVYVTELHRTVNVPAGEHYSCRGYVDAAYRSQSLLAHMIYAYLRTLRSDERVWALIYPTNLASIRSVERLGWRHTGNFWTRFVFGVKVTGEKHFSAPLAPTADPGTNA